MRRFLPFFLILFCVIQINNAVAQSKPLVTIAGYTFNQSDVSFTPEQLKKWQDDPDGQTRRQMYTFSKVAEFIHQHFITDFARRNQIVANADFVDSFKKTFGSKSLAGEKLDSLAQFSALEFAVDDFLYQQQGGRVIFDQSHPMLPIEAYFNAYKDYAEKQLLVFHHQDTEQLWWQSFARQNAIDIAAEKVDFSAPWWHKLN